MNSSVPYPPISIEIDTQIQYREVYICHRQIDCKTFLFFFFAAPISFYWLEIVKNKKESHR